MKPGQAVALIAELIDAAKNWLAMDGLWFQAVERAFGMDTVLGMDRDVWEQFAVIEAMRIKERLTLPDKGGLDTIEIAFKNRLVFLLNDLEFFRSGKKNLIVTTKTCRVQAAGQRKGLPLSPCKSVGIVEFSVFDRTIDPREVTTCLSCPSETLPGISYCSWQFTLEEDY